MTDTIEGLTLGQIAEGLRAYWAMEDERMRKADRLMRDYRNSREFEQILADTRLKARRNDGRQTQSRL